MFDANLMFTNSIAVTTNGNSTAVQINKTPAEGVTIGVDVTVFSGTSLDVDVYESANDSDYYKIASFRQITAVGQYSAQVQSNKKYLRLTYTVVGTTFTVQAGIISGPDKKAVSG